MLQPPLLPPLSLCYTAAVDAWSECCPCDVSGSTTKDNCIQFVMHLCRFMEDYDSRLDLAPRDIVARAIQDQMLSRRDSHVLLDIR